MKKPILLRKIYFFIHLFAFFIQENILHMVHPQGNLFCSIPDIYIYIQLWIIIILNHVPYAMVSQINGFNLSLDADLEDRISTLSHSPFTFQIPWGKMRGWHRQLQAQREIGWTLQLPAYRFQISTQKRKLKDFKWIHRTEPSMLVESQSFPSHQKILVGIMSQNIQDYPVWFPIKVKSRWIANLRKSCGQLFMHL